MKILLTLLVLLFTVSTSAGSTEVDSANFLAEKSIISDHREAANPLEAYRLNDTITRKEALKIVMKLSGKNIIDECRGDFSDVGDDWGCKYIEAALDAGYIAENNTFRPDDNITKTEAMKLVFKSKTIEKLKDSGDWKYDYMKTAHIYNIIDSEYTDFNADTTRGWIFKIATSTIKQEAEILEKKEENPEIISDEAL